MHYGRSGPAWCFCENYLYLIGGFRQNTIERYDQINNTWEIQNVKWPFKIADEFGYAGCLLDKSNCLVFGGYQT